MARESLLNVVLGLRTREFERGLTSAQKKLRATANNLSSVGRGLSIGVTAPLAAIGASSFKVAADFELAMKKVKATSQSTGPEFAQLEQNALDLGASTVFAASQVAGLQLEYAKLGLNTGEILNATESTLALAQAFDQELGPTAEVVGNTLNHFGLVADQASRVADVMAAAFSGSALDLVKFQEGMKNAGKVADTFGFTLEETTALLGILANNGIAGSDAGTKLKMAFSELAASGVDVKSTFTGLINGTLTYKQAIDVLGKRAAILQPIFGDNLEALEDFGKEVNNATGLSKRMAAEMDATASGGVAAMRSAIEGAQISLGKSLAPTVIDVARKITSLAQSFAGLSSGTRQSIVNVGLFAAAFGPLLAAIGSAIRSVQTLNKAIKNSFATLTTNPYAAIIAAAVALGAAMIKYGQESVIASDDVLSFNETIDAQNDLLSEGVKSLAARAALLREAFNLENSGKTIGELQQQTRALRQELENISPEALTRYNEAAEELASNPLLRAEVGLVPVVNPDTGQIDEAALRLNQQLTAEFAGVEFSTVTLDLINSIDPFGPGVDLDEGFKRVEDALIKRLNETQQALDQVQGDLESKVSVVVDVEGGGTGKVPPSLAEILAAMEKALTDVNELELTIGGDLDSDRFTIIQQAITSIIEADFEGVDETLAGLAVRMSEFAEETTTAATPIETLKGTIAELATAQGLGIISDLELAQQALTALDDALLSSVLADPDFVNSDQFKQLMQDAETFRALLQSTTEQQTEANEALFTAQEAGAAVADLVELGFKSATGEVTNFNEAAGRMLMNIALNAIKAAVAQGLANAMAPTPDNVASGGLAGVAKAAAIKAAISSLLGNMPKLARGGITMGPQIALIGDNPSGREAVIPFERMGEFVKMIGGNKSDVNVTGMIRGDAIVLAHERANRNRGR